MTQFWWGFASVFILIGLIVGGIALMVSFHIEPRPQAILGALAAFGVLWVAFGILMLVRPDLSR